MPTLGRPPGAEGKNPYQNVKKYEGVNSNSNQLKKLKSKGEYLNKISGNKDRVGDSGVKVVDGDKHGRLGKDGFLKILMYQLANQDPFKPVDQSKMAADLAQFSQLEQMTNMNKNLEKVFADDTVKKNFFAASFLGKKVITKGASVKHHGKNTTSSINFKVPKDVSNGIIQIFDKKDQMISQLDLGARFPGLHSISWDGKQLDGLDAGKGLYRFQIKAWDELKNEVPVETHAEGLVTGVTFDQYGEPVITVDNKRVYLRDIKSFQLAQDRPPVHHSGSGQSDGKMANRAYENTQRQDR